MMLGKTTFFSFKQTQTRNNTSHLVQEQVCLGADTEDRTSKSYGLGLRTRGQETPK